MPAVSGGDLTNLRGAHFSKMYLAVLVPVDIITARIDGDHTRGDETIACDTIVGTQAEVLSEMIVWFGSASGTHDLGCYMAKSMVGGVLTIEENDLDLDGNEYVTVKELWYPRSKLPSIDVSGADVVFRKWGDTYSDQNTQTPPINCMGPPDCQFIDPDLGYATVRFIDDYSWSPVGASLDVVTWDYDGGDYQSGAGTVASPNLVRYDTAGTYWVSLTIEDSNGKTTVSWRPIFIFDSNNMPYSDWNSTGRELGQSGNKQNFEVVGDADESEFPPGTWIVRFNRDSYVGSEAVIENTYPHRGHIKYAGFIREGTVQTDTLVSSVAFETMDITAYLDELPAFGDVIKDTASPANWTEMTNPTVIRAAVHVLMWQSNILTIADLRYSLARSDPSEIYIAAQRWGKASLLEQVNLPLLHRGIYAQCSGNKQGCLWIRQDPSLVPSASRGAYVPTVCHLTKADYSQLSFTTKFSTTIQYVRFTGIAYDGTTGTPYGAKAPGVPDQAIDVQDVDGQVLVSQADTNRLSGDLKAKLDNDIISAEMVLPGNWDIFDPSLQERITFDLLATENNLGLAYDNTVTWIVRGVDIPENPHLGVVSQVTLTLEKETYGVPGVALPIPGVPTWQAPTSPTPPPDNRGDTDSLFTTLIVGSRTAGVAFCESADIIPSAPTWQLMNKGLDVAGAHYIHALKIQQLSAAERWLYAATRCGMYRVRLPASSSNTWQYHLKIAEIITACGTGGSAWVQDIVFDWSISGHAWALVATGPTPPDYWHVLETWDSFETVSASTLIHTGAVDRGGMAVKRQNTNIILAHGTDVFTGGIFKSQNGGGSWVKTGPASPPWQGSHGEWCYAESGVHVWWMGAGATQTYYSDDGTLSWQTVTHTNFGAGDDRKKYHSNVYDPDSAFLITYQGVHVWNPGTPEWDQWQIGGNYNQDGKCISRNVDNVTPIYIVVVGGNGSAAEVFLLEDGTAYNRTGDLGTILAPEREGSASDIDCIAVNDWYGGEL